MDNPSRPAPRPKGSLGPSALDKKLDSIIRTHPVFDIELLPFRSALRKAAQNARAQYKDFRWRPTHLKAHGVLL